MTLRGMDASIYHQGSGSLQTVVASLGQASLASTGSGTITTAIGVQGSIWLSSGSTGTMTTARGTSGDIQLGNLASGQTVNWAQGLYGNMSSQAASTTVTNYSGLMIAQPVSSGTITNTYGAYIANQTSTGGVHTNTPYGIYQVGTGDRNYFGGNVGIGTTAPSTKLDVAGTVTSTGATVNGNLQTQQVTETAVNLGATLSGTVTMNMASGTYFYGTVTGATTFAVSNPATSGKVSSFTLELTNGGSQTLTWMSGTKWPGGTAPTFTSAGVDLIVCSTRDGGTTWRCVGAEMDSK